MFINEEIVSVSSTENVHNEARGSSPTEALSLSLCSHRLYYVNQMCNG